MNSMRKTALIVYGAPIYTDYFFVDDLGFNVFAEQQA